MNNEILLRSMVGARIWALYDTDPEAFKREVVMYFAKALPHYKVVKAVPSTRHIYLKRED